jgi:hypothetical protein
METRPSNNVGKNMKYDPKLSLNSAQLGVTLLSFSGLVRQPHQRGPKIEAHRGDARAQPLQSHWNAVEQRRVRRGLEVPVRKSHEPGAQVHSVVTRSAATET